MTFLVLAGEPNDDAPRQPTLSWWRTALVRAGVASAEEPLEIARPGRSRPDARVVVVVREQVDHINSRYCRAVLAMEPVADFETFAAAELTANRHRYDGRLLALLDREDVAAVPYSRLDPAPDPGPVLVTALRLLLKRLRRELPDGADPARLRRLAEPVVARAAESDWDTVGHWGWEPLAAAAAAAGFEATNEAFAARAWGTAWPDPPKLRTRTALDLANEPASIVADVVETLQSVVDRIADEQAGKRSTNGSTTEESAIPG